MSRAEPVDYLSVEDLLDVAAGWLLALGCVAAVFRPLAR